MYNTENSGAGKDKFMWPYGYRDPWKVVYYVFNQISDNFSNNLQLNRTKKLEFLVIKKYSDK